MEHTVREGAGREFEDKEGADSGRLKDLTEVEDKECADSGRLKDLAEVEMCPGIDAHGLVRDNFPEPHFSELVAVLDEQGVTMQDLMASTTGSLGCLDDFYPSKLVKFKFITAVKRKKAEVHRKEKLQSDEKTTKDEEDQQRKYMVFIGRVTTKFWDGTVQGGSCVLVREDGAALTALHIVRDVSNLKKKRKQMADIKVQFCCASTGPISYKAVIEVDADDIDLVLLRPEVPLEKQLVNGLKYFRDWQIGYNINEEVLLLSYPDVIDETVRDRAVVDKPSCDYGRISYGSFHEVCATYMCFPGSSGGLVVSYRTGMGLGLHLESVFHLDPHGDVEDNVQHKASYGIFTPLVGQFLSKVPHVPLNRRGLKLRFQQQVAAEQVAVEQLDLFGLWPGLDEDEEGLDDLEVVNPN